MVTEPLFKSKEWSGLAQWIWILPLLVLPVVPDVSALMVVVLGLIHWADIKSQRWLWMPMIIFLLLGLLSQAGAPAPPKPELPPWNAPPARVNLMPDLVVSLLAGRNIEDGVIRGFATFNNGYWKMPRINPQTGNTFVEMYLFEQFPLITGQTYTESVYFRHDGSSAKFSFSFLTARGHHVVPTTIVDVGGGLKRAYGTYKAVEGDQFVRGLDLLEFGGDWTYLDLAYPQLESSPAPSAYQFADPKPMTVLERFGWLLGTTLGGLLAFCGFRFVLLKIKIPAQSILFFGIVIAIIIVAVQYFGTPVVLRNRISGELSHPNLLGHLAVMSAALIWLMGSRRWALAGFIGAIILIALSGSRGSLLALSLLVIIWAVTLPYRWRIATFIGLLFAVVGLAALGTLGHLGRFGTSFDFGYISTLARLELWRVALQAFLEHPLTGIGVGNFSAYYTLNPPNKIIDVVAPHAHNIFLQLLAETGLVGTSGFLLLLSSMVFGLWRLGSKKAIIFILIALVLNLFDCTFFNAAVYYPIWLAVAWAVFSNQTKLQLSPLQ